MSNFGRYILLTLGLFCMSLAALFSVFTLFMIIDQTGADASAADGVGAVGSIIIVLLVAVPVGFIVWLGRYLLQKARNGKPEASSGAKFGSIFLLLAGIIIGLIGLTFVVAALIVDSPDIDYSLLSGPFLSVAMITITIFGPPSGAAIWLGLSILKAGGSRVRKEKPPAPTKVPSSSSQYRMVGGEREPLLHRPEKIPASSHSAKKAETLTCKGCGAKKTAEAGEAAICDYCGTALR